jgi:hypothetical protein
MQRNFTPASGRVMLLHTAVKKIGTRDCDSLSVSRVVKGQRTGSQHNRSLIQRRRAIQHISYDRVPSMGRLHSQLMHSPRFGKEFQQGLIRFLVVLDDFDPGYG